MKLSTWQDPACLSRSLVDSWRARKFSPPTMRSTSPGAPHFRPQGWLCPVLPAWPWASDCVPKPSFLQLVNGYSSRTPRHGAVAEDEACSHISRPLAQAWHKESACDGLRQTPTTFLSRSARRRSPAHSPPQASPLLRLYWRQGQPHDSAYFQEERGIPCHLPRNTQPLVSFSTCERKVDMGNRSHLSFLEEKNHRRSRNGRDRSLPFVCSLRGEPRGGRETGPRGQLPHFLTPRPILTRPPPPPRHKPLGVLTVKASRSIAPGLSMQAQSTVTAGRLMTLLFPLNPPLPAPLTAAFRRERSQQPGGRREEKQRKGREAE